jgi:hypothetical protein
MKRFLILAVTLLHFCRPDAYAAVISRDWKTPSDGLLTYDDVNQREWLDLSQTILSDQFPSTGTHPLEIRESRYQYVVGQTSPGGLFEGFKVSRSGQVVTLAQSAGIDTSTDDIFLNSSPADSLMQLLSVTRDTTSGSRFAVGLLNQLSISPMQPFRLSGSVFVNLVSGPNGRAGLRLDTGYTQFPPSTVGVFLFRAIPEPCTCLLLFVGLGVLATKRQSTRSRC